MPVHDGFGQSGGAAGIDDPDRMIERQPLGLEGRHGGVVARDDVGPQCLGWHRRGGKGGLQQHQRLHARQAGAQLGQYRAAVERLATVIHAVDGDQHFGFDLAQAVDHGGGAHVGRAHAPHRADAEAGQRRDHRLRHVGQVGRDAVAALHAEVAQGERGRSHLALELGPRQLARFAEFVVADDGR